MSQRIVTLLLLFFACTAAAQDATQVEPTHYRVAFENEHVRVVDVHYGPHEKSAMHSHPAGVLVYITSGDFRIIDDKGNVTEPQAKPGEARWFPAFKHKVENLTDKPFDAVYIEIKGN